MYWMIIKHGGNVFNKNRLKIVSWMLLIIITKLSAATEKSLKSVLYIGTLK